MAESWEEIQYGNSIIYYKVNCSKKNEQVMGIKQMNFSNKQGTDHKEY